MVTHYYTYLHRPHIIKVQNEKYLVVVLNILYLFLVEPAIQHVPLALADDTSNARERVVNA